MRRTLLCSSLLAGSALLANGARAHINLDEPQRRYEDQKGAVCGKGGGLDARSDRFTRFEPGQTINVKWTETIDHVGSFRVAFDDDGGDRDDFDENVLFSEDDPANEGGKVRETLVTLPSIECTNCTLQLIQVMTTGAAADDNTYHQCADLVLGDGDSPGTEGGGCSSGAQAASPAAILALLLLLRRRPLA